jgi:hypothetical protein
MLTYGLVHGSWGHLLFNMLTLYFFGTVVEAIYEIEGGYIISLSVGNDVSTIIEFCKSTDVFDDVKRHL